VTAPPVDRPVPAARSTASAPASWLRRNGSLLVTPLIVIFGLGGVLLWVSRRELDPVEANVLTPVSRIWARLAEHLVLTGASTLIVVIIAVPLGIALSRPRLPARLRGGVLAASGFGQALPPFGLIILLAFSPLGFGATTAILALVLASLLPVLRNTVVGLQQVDRSLVEAARGMGMSARQTLLRVELPLAVPVMVAGIRVALVLNVGTAVLATYINGGGLGDILDGALRTNRPVATLTAGAIVAGLALTVDWLAGLAERLVRARI